MIQLIKKIIAIIALTAIFCTIVNILNNKLSNKSSDNSILQNKPLQSIIEKDLDKDNQDEMQAVKFMSDLIKLTKQGSLQWNLSFDKSFDIAFYICRPTKNSMVCISCKEDASENLVSVRPDVNTLESRILLNLPLEYRTKDIPKFAEYLNKKYGKETEMRFKSARVGDDNTDAQFNDLANAVSKKVSIK